MALAGDVFSFTDSTNPIQTGASSAEVDVPGGPGAINVTGVRLNGQDLQPGDDYVLIDDGTSKPRIGFLIPIPSGANIAVRGSTANNGTYNAGELTDWRP